MVDLAEMVRAWVRGWAISRGAPAPVSIEDGVRVDGDQTRYVFHTFDRPRLAALGRELTTPGTEIKVVAESARLRSALPDDWSMYEACDLMTAVFRRAVVEVPGPYVARIVEDGATLVGSILDGGGGLVSSARLAACGPYGVIDQVGTRSSHRRRGLASVLMRMLGDRAVDAGLSTGLLSATADGRALYSALGWRAVGELAGAYRSGSQLAAHADPRPAVQAMGGLLATDGV